jgi:hypothetical protein
MPLFGIDLYALLGIERNATNAEITNHIVKKVMGLITKIVALVWHPDKVPEAQKPQAKEMYIMIQQAKDILLDGMNLFSEPTENLENKRQLYDRYGLLRSLASSLISRYGVSFGGFRTSCGYAGSRAKGFRVHHASFTRKRIPIVILPRSPAKGRRPKRKRDGHQDSDLQATLIWQESARSHFILGHYSAAEPFIRQILERFEAKYGTRLIKGHDEVVQMLSTLYCRTKEWSKTEQILTEFLRIKRERRLYPIDTNTELNFHAAVRPLLAMWADIRSLDPTTALHLAATYGCVRIVRILLESHGGCDVDERNRHGDTALMSATDKGHEAIVRRLLEKGAQVDAVNPSGITALSAAAWKGHRTIVSLLLENRAEINLTTNSGVTALGQAASGRSRGGSTLTVGERGQCKPETHTYNPSSSGSLPRARGSYTAVVGERGRSRRAERSRTTSDVVGG